MRSRVAFITFTVAVSALALPLAAHAASIPFFGPIIQESWRQCALGWGAGLLVVNNIIRLLLTLIVVFVAPLMIAYAGFLFVVNPVNPSGKEHAKTMLKNLVIGFVIALAAWLIVDLIMATLYNGAFGSWSEIITTGGQDACLATKTELNPNKGSTGAVTSSTPVATASNDVLLPRTPFAQNAGCQPASILAAAQAGGYSLTNAQANTLSCIAVPESACGTKNTGAKTSTGQSTTATGMFQIVFGQGKTAEGTLNTNDACHNLNLSVCTDAAKAAGYSVSGNLNCSNAFSGGVAKSDPASQQLAAACRAAALNVNCNVSAAACLLQKHPNYSDWTGTGDGFTHASQKKCVADNGGGGVASPFSAFLSLFNLL